MNSRRMHRLRTGIYCGLRMGFYVAVLTAPMALAAIAQERPSQDGFLFSHADRDRSGTLSPAEFSSVYHSAVQGGSSSDRDAAFAMADTNGDGALDRSEFSSWFRQRR